MSEFKNCPFCGCEVQTTQCDEYFEVKCSGEDCVAKTYDDKASAIAHWNTRADSAELATFREQVKVLRRALIEIENWDVQGMRLRDSYDDSYGSGSWGELLGQTKPKDGER